MKCHRSDSGAQCPICLTAAGLACPMVEVDTSHQGRGDQTVANEVSLTPDEVLGPADAPEAEQRAPSTAKIIGIHDRKEIEHRPGEVDPFVLKRAEELLEAVKSGKVVALAYAGTMADGGICTDWAGTPTYSIWILGGAINHLAHRFHDRQEEFTSKD